jgi:hypothetical protein
VSEPVRLSNRRQFRRPLLWGGSAISLGALLGLSSWLLPDVFDALGSTAIGQAGSAVLALLGIGIISYALTWHVLWVEFGERIRVRRALSARVIEWNEVASLALEEERVEVRPLAPLANLPGALGVPGVVAAARLTGVTDVARFHLLFGRLCLRLSGGIVIRCDVRLLEWESIVELARSRSVPVSQG